MNRFWKISLVAVICGLALSILSSTADPASNASILRPERLNIAGGMKQMAGIKPVSDDDAQNTAINYVMNQTLDQFRVFLPLISYDCSQERIDSDFAENACGWQPRRGEWVVENDTYSTGGVRERWASASYDGSFVNLDYRARIKRAGCEFCANQLLVRGEPDPLKRDGTWRSAYAFQFSRDGHYSVWVSVDGSPYLPLKKWTFSPAIRQGDAWNELRVVAVNRLLLFYINDEQVWSGLGDVPSEGEVGIGMYRDEQSSGNDMMVDWATLAPLPHPGVPEGMDIEEFTQSSQLDFGE